MNDKALIIIAKYPEPKSVKTRLKDLLPDKERLKLYIGLLEDTVQRLKAVPGVDMFIAYAPPDAEDYFSRFGARLIPLTEGDLGERMQYAFAKVFAEGYQKAVLVGVDIPGLSAAITLKSFEPLSDNDIVYGPAEDGGYYLVGMRKLIQEIFEDVPWSSDQTLKRSLEKTAQSGYSVALTETLYDIDTIEDAKRAGLIF